MQNAKGRMKKGFEQEITEITENGKAKSPLLRRPPVQKFLNGNLDRRDNGGQEIMNHGW
jgi:hypothetical protein